MKWLLVTTTSNPGDSFARFGIEEIIHECDPNHAISLLDKENDADWRKMDSPFEFDWVVVCGMPLFWSHAKQTCNSIWWWEKLFRSNVPKRNILAIGVGDYLGENGITDRDEYIKSITEVRNATRFVSMRNSILLHPDSFLLSFCPSMFLEFKPAGDRKFCNFMAGGSHEPELSPNAASAWKTHGGKVIQRCCASGFEFVAHSELEKEIAIKSNFKVCHYFKDHRKYLDLYSSCGTYVGNRVHGAVMAAMNGAETCCINADSRSGMLGRIGISAISPIDLPLLQFSKITPSMRDSIAHARTELVREFRQLVEST